MIFNSLVSHFNLKYQARNFSTIRHAVEQVSVRCWKQKYTAQKCCIMNVRLHRMWSLHYWPTNWRAWLRRNDVRILLGLTFRQPKLFPIIGSVRMLHRINACTRHILNTETLLETNSFALTRSHDGGGSPLAKRLRCEYVCVSVIRMAHVYACVCVWYIGLAIKLEWIGHIICSESRYGFQHVSIGSDWFN